MAFFLTCGTHTFTSLLAGHENITVQCSNCGNNTAKIFKRWEWFTICFVPLIPFSFKPWHDVSCHVCNFHQDIRQRPDVQSRMNGQPSEQVPMQPYHQGWNGQQQQPTSQQPQRINGPEYK